MPRRTSTAPAAPVRMTARSLSDTMERWAAADRHGGSSATGGLRAGYQWAGPRLSRPAASLPFFTRWMAGGNLRGGCSPARDRPPNRSAGRRPNSTGGGGVPGRGARGCRPRAGACRGGRAADPHARGQPHRRLRARVPRRAPRPASDRPSRAPDRREGDRRGGVGGYHGRRARPDRMGPWRRPARGHRRPRGERRAARDRPRGDPDEPRPPARHPRRAGPPRPPRGHGGSPQPRAGVRGPVRPDLPGARRPARGGPLSVPAGRGGHRDPAQPGGRDPSEPGGGGGDRAADAPRRALPRGPGGAPPDRAMAEAARLAAGGAGFDCEGNGPSVEASGSSGGATAE